ncbi:related to oxidoreductase, FAD-binding [Rhynchosporium secalis]|uniref:Related to oxidoreductase, FAD-binding n=1 Tax=Rhynchosporium secalis TaxID=38038 RepID=A0A1E1MCQ5_RHYSE|nr:related to oxidoreductase, FAD-binding [Rhynchosporium secalis]
MEVLTPAYLSTIPFLNSSISFPASFGQNNYHMSFGGRGIPWIEGEKEMHRIMQVAGQGNPNSPFLSPGAGYMIQDAPLLALGALDDQGRPWTTIWGGDPGLGKLVVKNVIGIKTAVDRRLDPVVEALLGNAVDCEVVRGDGEGRMVGGLTIDLESRMRIKLHGNMIAGAVEGSGDKEKGVGQMQLVVSINKSVGNCPKYLNSKRIIPSTPQPKLKSDSAQLPPEVLALLDKADMFFMSSSDGSDIDTNHRGGSAGLVRVISNEESGAVIIYPEYSGNRLYESLGNLKMNPLIGMTVPDFDTGDVLYLTGKTEILIGKEADSRDSWRRDLDQGYSHMRDEDPQSLNDDFLRTFTVSSPPSASKNEFEITIRKVGRVTSFLFEQQQRAKLAGDFKIPLKGFGGEFRIEKQQAGGIIPVIAGGIGITPLLGQLDSMDVKQLRLLWGIGIEDVGLVADTLRGYPQLAGSTTIFLSGEDADSDLEGLRILSDIVRTGIKIERRRMQEKDVVSVIENHEVDEWYMCVSLRLKSLVLTWLAGRKVVFEDFGY